MRLGKKMSKLFFLLSTFTKFVNSKHKNKSNTEDL